MADQNNQVSDTKNESEKENCEIAPVIEEDQPVRETTQTDHLNKKLLSAFLGKINATVEGQSGDSIDDCEQDWQETSN